MKKPIIRYGIIRNDASIINGTIRNINGQIVYLCSDIDGAICYYNRYKNSWTLNTKICKLENIEHKNFILAQFKILKDYSILL
jgi:hypothetical protein